MGFRAQGFSGFRFGAQGWSSGVEGLVFWGSGFGVQGLGFESVGLTFKGSCGWPLANFVLEIVLLF